jgi:hypothetical protein
MGVNRIGMEETMKLPTLAKVEAKLGPAEAWWHVEALLGPSYLTDLGEKDKPGDVTEAQLFWLANAPYHMLAPHARAIYAAIEKLGRGALIPIDNARRAEREKS